jgi:hypothetical protein
MEKISWTEHVKNEKYDKQLRRKDNLHAIQRRQANWVGHIFFLKHVIGEKCKEG